MINNNERYCLWLKDVDPQKYRKNAEIIRRLNAVMEIRKNSPTASVQKDAVRPMLFTQIRQPETNYLAVPEVSSENRRYIPISFMTPDVIASNKLYLVPNANLYMFGVMISNIHMAWMRTVCGRLKSDYSYSPAVYNNFPWPHPNETQKAKIEKTAKAILDARSKYKDSSLSEMYGDLMYMYPDLLVAHQKNDKAVWEAYGKTWRISSESECVAELMRMYQELTK